MQPRFFTYLLLGILLTGCGNAYQHQATLTATNGQAIDQKAGKRIETALNLRLSLFFRVTGSTFGHDSGEAEYTGDDIQVRLSVHPQNDTVSPLLTTPGDLMLCRPFRYGSPWRTNNFNWPDKVQAVHGNSAYACYAAPADTAGVIAQLTPYLSDSLGLAWGWQKNEEGQLPLWIYSYREQDVAGRSFYLDDVMSGIAKEDASHYALLLSFDDLGRRQLEQFTTNTKNATVLAVMDGRLIGSKTFNEVEAKGRIAIKGPFSPLESHQLACILRYGPLPLPLSIQQVQPILKQ